VENDFEESGRPGRSRWRLVKEGVCLGFIGKEIGHLIRLSVTA